MKFKVGEIVVTQGLVRDPSRNGLEVEVLTTPVPYLSPAILPSWNGGVWAGANRYQIRWPDGTSAAVLEDKLRKRHPPEEPGSWEEIERLTNWNPTRVHA